MTLGVMNGEEKDLILAMSLVLIMDLLGDGLAEEAIQPAIRMINLQQGLEEEGTRQMIGVLVKLKNMECLIVAVVELVVMEDHLFLLVIHVVQHPFVT